MQVTQYQEDRWEDWQEKQRNIRDGKKITELLTSASLSIFSFSKTSQYSDSSSFSRISFNSSMPVLLEAVLEPCEESHLGLCFLLIYFPAFWTFSSFPRPSTAPHAVLWECPGSLLSQRAPTSLLCSSSSGAAFWFVRRSNRISDPGNKAQMDRASASSQGKTPSHLPSGLGRPISSLLPCYGDTVVTATSLGLRGIPYPSCDPRWRPPL